METIGIVGGGIMGCLAALGFAKRGKRVVIHERLDRLMAGASRGNEGKIHLGFTYGLDKTGATRDVMFRYGVAFEAALRQLIDTDTDPLFLHRRQYYAVHRDSALSDEGVAAHMMALGDALLDANGVAPGGEAPARRLSVAERQAVFGEDIRDCYEVAESSIDCVRLGEMVRAAVAAEPRIEVRFSTQVADIADSDRPTLVGTDGKVLGRFDLVINAAWEGMPLLERKAGAPLPDFCLRAKAGFVTAVPEGLPAMPVTTVYGTFGDVVPQGNGLAYLSWYPACLIGFTTDLDNAHQWYDQVVGDFDADAAYAETCAAFARLIPAFRAAPAPDYRLGGPILAVAKTDIPDLDSRLHQRTHFGFHSRGEVIAIDTGKLTCGPKLALELMDYTLG